MWRPRKWRRGRGEWRVEAHTDKKVAGLVTCATACVCAWDAKPTTHTDSSPTLSRALTMADPYPPALADAEAGPSSSALADVARARAGGGARPASASDAVFFSRIRAARDALDAALSGVDQASMELAHVQGCVRGRCVACVWGWCVRRGFVCRSAASRAGATRALCPCLFLVARPRAALSCFRSSNKLSRPPPSPCFTQA
jgi:hypothetical protein